MTSELAVLLDIVRVTATVICACQQQPSRPRQSHAFAFDVELVSKYVF